MDEMPFKLTQIRQIKQQLNKAAHEPFKAGPDLIELNNKVKYLRGVLDNTLNFDHTYPLRYKRQ